jgi:cytochrome oxidase Cu insertion factor (SCO1/SenC/PrrC family)
MSTPTRAAKTKARRTLLAIVAVFALPLVLAWLFTIGPLDWRPAKTVNYGVLLEPPLRLQSYGVMDAAGTELTVEAVARDWFLVVLHATRCTKQCQGLLQIAERIRIAVGRDMSRITLALLGPVNEIPVPRAQSWLLPADGKLIGAVRRAMGAPLRDSILLIVDHRGRIILMYPPAEDGQGVLDDLKRLLRASAR